MKTANELLAIDARCLVGLLEEGARLRAEERRIASLHTRDGGTYAAVLQAASDVVCNANATRALRALMGDR